ncbi:MAG TPA: PQQ-dependent sugar dehydrogenase [Pyrinomonadaceae bacterium]|nr:PQQ-dependent sugar dehydrogenase [Pyrinomonadaceae bacterium]
MNTITKIKLLVILLFAVGVAVILLTDNAANPRARAFSAGPPAGYTHAPGEVDCSDCHTTPARSTGTITLDTPQHYTPGQTYDINVTHASPDPTRIRWGFELTALDSSDEKAGALAPSDDLTQAVNNQGSFPTRQYIEHTSKGTFPGQQNGAHWTFKWTAPDGDVGPVTFYVAGNQANGDGNSSGDNIYFTFATATFQPPAPDFSVALTPASRTVTPGGAATYNVTVTPLNGFTGQVALSATGLPAGASPSFQPANISITDANPQSSTLTVSSASSTPIGSSTLNVSATSGQLSHASQATLNVVAATDADLSISQAVSPNPGLAGADLHFTYTVSNNGPAAADATALRVTLPPNIGSTFNKGAGTCTLVVLGQAGFEYDCSLETISAGSSVAIDFTIHPTTPGTLNTSASASANEHDPFPSNNTVTAAIPVNAQSATPSMTVTNLGVRTVVSGLNQPTSLAFIGPEDFLILEKPTGRVLRVKNGVVQGVVLDLAVNNASERGLLGIALHPNFASNGFVYLYWTESSTGVDTSAIDEVPLLGNRVDRFVWNGSTLTLERNLIRLHALQQDAGQPSRGNHNGGVLRFGPDGKLYVVIGDNGRRGLLQNLPCGPTANCPGPAVQDDQNGGPEPDDSHLTGVILRLNDDGTTPADNPFFNAQTALSGQAAANVRKIFGYGIRNSFGMDFDPVGGSLWTEENGDNSFDEINRVEAGFDGGWVQLMGPSSRIGDFKSIEVAANGLQQIRWPPTNIADTPQDALARLFNLPGSHYTEPQFSWKHALAPSPVGFVKGNGLGAQYANDLFVGAARTTLLGGYLFRFRLSADRKSIATTDSRLADGVADNLDKFDVTESESLVVGRDFGITTDIQTAPDGTLYVVSLSNGAVYQIFPKSQLFVANLDGSQETPPDSSNAKGAATLLLDRDEQTALVSLRFGGLSSAETFAKIHGPAAPGQTASPVFDLPSTGNFTDFPVTLTPQQVSDLKSGLFYVNVRSVALPAGEIRGQFGAVSQTSVLQLDIPDPTVSEGAGVKTINVVRLGDTSSAATVDYATSDGTASERSDYTTARGTLRFAPGESQKSFDVLITDDGLQEGSETFNVTLSNPTGSAVLNAPSNAVVTIVDNDAAPPPTNPVDDTQFFVRQHYHDFLSREPDASGLQFWTNNIESCGADAQCRAVKRVDTSAAFFLSIEFQQTGYLVYRFYGESFARQPRYGEFIPDVQEIGRGVVVGQGNWQQQLDANKQVLADEWVARPSFKSAFDALSNLDYVNKLYSNAGVTPATSERDALVAALDTNAKTRSRVLLDMADNASFKQQEFDRAFVLMEYFGYLRRNPDDSPDHDRAGYDFWLSKLDQFGGNYVSAEMVRAFISSTEYRQRFGQP